MDNKTLDRIKQAEKRADDILKTAVDQAKKLEEQSVKKLASNKETFETNLEKQSNDIIQAEIAIAKKEATAILAANKVACEKLFADSQDKIEQAVSLVVEKIGVSKWQ